MVAHLYVVVPPCGQCFSPYGSFIFQFLCSLNRFIFEVSLTVLITTYLYPLWFIFRYDYCMVVLFNSCPKNEYY